MPLGTLFFHFLFRHRIQLRKHVTIYISTHPLNRLYLKAVHEMFLKKMTRFNIYFCIKQGKIATFSTSLHGLAVRRLTSSMMYHPGDNLFMLQLSMIENIKAESSAESSLPMFRQFFRFILICLIICSAKLLDNSRLPSCKTVCIADHSVFIYLRAFFVNTPKPL